MTTETRPVQIDLHRAEQWVIHHVMLDSIGIARARASPVEPPECVLEILRKLEAENQAFTPLELDHIRHACGAYGHANDTPDIDRQLASGIVDQITEMLDDEDLHAPTSTSR